MKFLQGKLRPYAFLGPDFGIMLSATQTRELTGQAATDADFSDVIGTDFSLDFGGGAEYAVAPKISVIGDVRYMLGLKSVYSNANQPTNRSRPVESLLCSAHFFRSSRLAKDFDCSAGRTSGDLNEQMCSQQGPAGRDLVADKDHSFS